ncbi:MAG TPA: hypothetical protein VGN12_08565 [Pirellulales bacterium]
MARIDDHEVTAVPRPFGKQTRDAGCRKERRRVLVLLGPAESEVKMPFVDLTLSQQVQDDVANRCIVGTDPPREKVKYPAGNRIGRIEGIENLQDVAIGQGQAVRMAQVAA